MTQTQTAKPGKISRKNLVYLFAVIYLAIGLSLGLVMQHALPAMNALGVVYYMMTWPLWLIGIALPISTAMFSFPG